jgi:hypothetical protein
VSCEKWGQHALRRTAPAAPPVSDRVTGKGAVRRRVHPSPIALVGESIGPQGASVEEDDTQQRAVDRDSGFQITVVLDETQFLELVHEEVHARASRADHF